MYLVYLLAEASRMYRVLSRKRRVKYGRPLTVFDVAIRTSRASIDQRDQQLREQCVRILLNAIAHQVVASRVFHLATSGVLRGHGLPPDL